MMGGFQKRFTHENLEIAECICRLYAESFAHLFEQNRSRSVRLEGDTLRRFGDMRASGISSRCCVASRCVLALSRLTQNG